jgi:hypothetical protein
MFLLNIIGLLMERLCLRRAIAGCPILISYEGFRWETVLASKIEQQRERSDVRLLVASEEANVLGFISLRCILQVALEDHLYRINYFCVKNGARSL